MYPVIRAHDGAAPMPSSLLELGSLVGFELLVGVAIGFLASLPLLATELGGMIVGQQLGLGFARVYNPAMESDADVIGQMLFYLALSVFIAVGGLEIIFSMLLNTFGNIPPGAFRISGDFMALAAGLLTSAFELAIRVAAPVLCLVFLESFALGFMNKTAPAFNILSLGFPIRIMLGTVALIAALGPIHEGVLDLTSDVLSAMTEFFSSLH
jgi:flagellar biosynthesis protein FliR